MDEFGVYVIIEGITTKKPYRKGVRLDLSNVSEQAIEMSLLGEIGEPFKALLLDAIRTIKMEADAEGREINLK